jgi:hypothetical protein
MFFQMVTWWFTTFMAPAIKQKVFSLPGVEYLYTAMTPDQLEIPAFITEYDMTVSCFSLKISCKFSILAPVFLHRSFYYTTFTLRLIGTSSQT